MTITFTARTCALALWLGACLMTMPASGQGGPVAGSIALGLGISPAHPAVASNFTVDVSINLASATGRCEGTNATAPMTLGAYVLGIGYDGTLVEYVGASRCPNTHPQMTDPSCFPNAQTPGAAVVRCIATSTASLDHPQGGPLCVARLTFANRSAAGGNVAVLRTLHSPAPFGVGTDYFRIPTVCGGPVTFPANAVSDATVTVSAN